ncbi:MAG TPA: transglutaminase domain-containing protein [Thermoanaerobaculia bacterium]|nr:transglutaminase domain-containing protein [Thermoanaerobaculia bacterium]
MRRLLLILAFATSAFAGSKTFDATYVATLSDIPTVEKLDVWIPLPKSSEHQTVRDVAIDSPYRFTRHTDPVWGNEYAHATIAKPPSSLTVNVKFNVTRHEARLDPVKGNMDVALRADRLVTLSPRVRQLADEVTAGKTTPRAQARAIYDHLLATMTYDKVAPGWGQGDTERACDIRKGNCTDFHSLFMSLARAKGIPSRFVIGFPMTAKEGVVKGYHCWAEFWDGKGWVPVDASDAAKNATLRDYLFGNLDPDRVQFTIGRDLTLTPATAEPLNYFIYPRGEAGGSPAGVPGITLEFAPR